MAMRVRVPPSAQMKIFTKSEAIHAEKPEGLSVDYYLFPEYEIHYNTQAPHSTQIWHHHETIWETLIILSGELIVMWKEENNEVHQVVGPGDVIETEHTPHTLKNNSNKPAEFMVIKQVLSGHNNSVILKEDKIIDENPE